MKDRFFLDTNIIVYSFDETELSKRSRARELISLALETSAGVISYQVVQEFINFGLKQDPKGKKIEQNQQYFNKVLYPLCLVQSSQELYNLAFFLKARTRFSWYDSLIIAAAQLAKCSVLYSEDMQNGRKIDGLRIENPFVAK